uniref:Uncharacterized protein n=1 Tax=Aegilops tauschii TaxID=37682 RepID=M8CVK5_AEGTA
MVAAEEKIKPAKLPNGMSHSGEGQKAEITYFKKPAAIDFEKKEKAVTEKKQAGENRNVIFARTQALLDDFVVG